MNAVVAGHFGPESLEEMRLALLRGDAAPAFFDDVEQAIAQLGAPNAEAPRCIFVDGAAPGLEPFIAWVRGEAKLFSVPVVVLVPTLDEGAFAESHALGADDVVLASDTEGIHRRVANLANFDPQSRPPITQGRALVAHPDMGRRRVLGRILRQAGFDVLFASTEEEVLAITNDSAEAPKLAVISHELNAMRLVPSVREVTQERTPFIVLAPARHLRSMEEQSDGLGRVAVSSELAPADNLLFLANELLRPDVENIRASARLLYGTIAAFRVKGEFQSVYGLTYNISREGLYIRTLDAPPRDTEVWLELRPPRSGSAVHLRGKVVWSRSLDKGVGGAAPPGFGIRLDEKKCPPSDVSEYFIGYESLVHEPRLFN